MKRLTILTLTVFSLAIIAFSTAYACGAMHPRTHGLEQ